MTIETSLLLFTAILIFAITPGPAVFAVLANALAFGVQRSLVMIVGIVIVDIVYLLMACLGLTYLAENWAQLFTFIRFLGAAYLIYLGWKIWTAPADFYTEAEAVKTSNRPLKSFLQGFLISASNPKVILFYLAFLPTLIDLSRLDSADILLMIAVAVTGLVLVLVLVAVGAAQARHYFQSARAIRRLNKTAGVTMVGAGVFLVSRQ